MFIGKPRVVNRPTHLYPVVNELMYKIKKKKKKKKRIKNKTEKNKNENKTAPIEDLT